jgi:hypothetical protein
MGASPDRTSSFEVDVFYVSDNWANAAEGGRATNRGLYRAELGDAKGCAGYGATVEEAVEHLASDLVAFVEADGYPYAVLLRNDDWFESNVVRAAARGTLVADLLAGAREPVLDASS